MILTDADLMRLAWFAMNLAKAVYRRFGYVLIVSLARLPAKRLTLVRWRFDIRSKQWSAVYIGRDHQVRERLIPSNWSGAAGRRYVRTELLDRLH